jgi:hypothetical protein
MQHQFVCRCECAYNNVGLKKIISTILDVLHLFSGIWRKVMLERMCLLCKGSFELTCVQLAIMNVQR